MSRNNMSISRIMYSKIPTKRKISNFLALDCQVECVLSQTRRCLAVTFAGWNRWRKRVKVIIRSCIGFTWPRCVDSVSCLVVPSHDVMNSNERTTKQPCTACCTGSNDQHADIPFMLILALAWHYYSIIR